MSSGSKERNDTYTGSRAEATKVDGINREVLGEGQGREQTGRDFIRYGRNDSEEEDGGRGEGRKQ
jgi:hypothetical protein